MDHWVSALLSLCGCCQLTSRVLSNITAMYIIRSAVERGYGWSPVNLDRPFDPLKSLVLTLGIAAIPNMAISYALHKDFIPPRPAIIAASAFTVLHTLDRVYAPKRWNGNPGRIDKFNY